MLFIPWVLKPNTENSTLPPLLPPVKFYLLISLLSPTAEVNYNCGSILSKIYSTRRYLKEDNYSRSIFTLLIKEQWVHLLKVSRSLLLFKRTLSPDYFFTSQFLFFFRKSKELGWDRPGRGTSKHAAGTILSPLFSAPGPSLSSLYAQIEQFSIQGPELDLWVLWSSWAAWKRRPTVFIGLLWESMTKNTQDPCSKAAIIKIFQFEGLFSSGIDTMGYLYYLPFFSTFQAPTTKEEKKDISLHETLDVEN